MQIRKQQISTLEETQTRGFEDRMHDSILEYWPDTPATSGQDASRDLIRTGSSRASNFGLTSERDTATYINCMELCGPDFHNEPWAQKILYDPSLTPAQKADDLARQAPLSANASDGRSDAFQAFQTQAGTLPSTPVGASAVSCSAAAAHQTAETKPPVKVHILEAPNVDLVLSPPGQAPPSQVLHAVNEQPPGGQFHWELLQPGAVKMNGPDGVRTMPTAGVERGAAQVQLTYTYAGETATDSVRIEVRAPLINATPQSYDFETVQVGKTSPVLIISVTNPGDAPLRITDLSLQPDRGDFVIGNKAALPKVIAPDAPPVPVRLVFQPHKLGEQNTYLVIRSNACNAPELSIRLRGKAIESHWIEIELLGEDDRPIPGEEYVVVLPDGRKLDGYLDNDGFARIDKIDRAGQCRINFPRLDKDAWQFIQALPSKAQQSAQQAAAN